MPEFQTIFYQAEISKETPCTLAADIGGTNSNFGIFLKNGPEPKLLLLLRYPSQKITHFPSVVKQLLDYLLSTYAIHITESCIAGAGPVSADGNSVKPTNLSFTIFKSELLAETDLQTVVLANDFEVIGHGLDLIDQNQIIPIRQGVSRPHANRAIIGAGTGLGKCLLVWDNTQNQYRPIASEGGHADCSPQTKVEFELINYMRSIYHREHCPISWENILSGDGIKAIYSFFEYKDNNLSNEIYNGPHPDEIFTSRNRNRSSQQTVDLYTHFYARCAKNYALDTLSFGGLYIAGGIAAKNIPLFQSKLFHAEFMNCNKQLDLLREIPLYIIGDYNVSLFGAAKYLYLFINEYL